MTGTGRGDETGTGARTGERPSFVDALAEDTPYVLAMYLLVVGVAALFVDYGALSAGRLTYRTLAGGGGPLLEAAAGAFALGFLVAALLAAAFAVDVFHRERRERLDTYELEERVSLVAVMPALQLLALVLCPVVTGVTLVTGVEFLLGLV